MVFLIIIVFNHVKKKDLSMTFLLLNTPNESLLIQTFIFFVSIPNLKHKQNIDSGITIPQSCEYYYVYLSFLCVSSSIPTKILFVLSLINLSTQ